MALQELWSLSILFWFLCHRFDKQAEDPDVTAGGPLSEPRVQSRRLPCTACQYIFQFQGSETRPESLTSGLSRCMTVKVIISTSRSYDHTKNLFL